MSEARFQNAWPTPPAATTASHSRVPAAGTAKPPGGMMFEVHAWLRAAAGFGATPVDSRRPIREVTGPKTLTWPTAQSESRSAHGVVHWPTNTLPKLPWMPAAEFRDETVTDW